MKNTNQDPNEMFNPLARLFLLILLVVFAFLVLVLVSENGSDTNQITGNPILEDEPGDVIGPDDTEDADSSASSSSGGSNSMQFMRFEEANVPSDAFGVYTIFPSFYTEVDYDIKEYNDIVEVAILYLQEVDECKKDIIPPGHENYSEDQNESKSIRECVTRKKPLEWDPEEYYDDDFQDFIVYSTQVVNDVTIYYKLALYFGDTEYDIDDIEISEIEFPRPVTISSYYVPGTGDSFGESAIITENSILFDYVTRGDTNFFVALKLISSEFNKRGVTITPELVSAMSVTLIKEVGVGGFLPVEEMGDYGMGPGCSYGHGSNGDICRGEPYYGGIDYKGRGYIQATHEGEYRADCGEDCLVNFKDECMCKNTFYCQNQNCPPAKALQPDIAASIFANFYNRKTYHGNNLVYYANQGQFYTVGWLINGGESYGRDFETKARNLNSILNSNRDKTAGLLNYLNN